MPKRQVVLAPKIFNYDHRKFSLENNWNILPFGCLLELVKILTPRRLELLYYLATRGALTIRTLSKELNRNYSNIHKDVQKLTRLGLIEKEGIDKVFVPWTEIITYFTIVISDTEKTPRDRHQKC